MSSLAPIRDVDRAVILAARNYCHDYFTAWDIQVYLESRGHDIPLDVVERVFCEQG